MLGIDLFHTNLRTLDGVDIVIPNSSILSGNIRNMSAFPERVIATSIVVSADSDLSGAIGIVRDIIGANPKVQKEREQVVAVKSLQGGAAEMSIAVWVLNEDYRDVRSAILSDIKQRFEKDGIKLG